MLPKEVLDIVLTKIVVLGDGMVALPVADHKQVDSHSRSE
jgi:hypothetical protein